MYSANVVAPAGRELLHVAILISGGQVVVGQQLLTVTPIEAVVAHCPALGVKVYVIVPILAVDIVAGDHVPVIPLFEVLGNVPGVSPTQ